MKWFDANGTDVDAYPDRAFKNGVYEGDKTRKIVKVKDSYYCEKCKETFTLPFYCIHKYNPEAPTIKMEKK